MELRYTSHESEGRTRTQRAETDAAHWESHAHSILKSPEPEQPEARPDRRGAREGGRQESPRVVLQAVPIPDGEKR